MLPIVWTSEFNVNIKIIDEQHKKLVETINMLYDAVMKGQGKSALAEVFRNLTEYTSIHFTTEEDFMIKYSYPGYEEQKKEHERCISKMLDFKHRFDKGDVTVAVDITAFLSDWLNMHLLDMDQKYKDFFNERGLF